MSTSTTETRSQRRRRDIERLKREGRPAGPPPAGFRHLGPKGQRFRVRDPEALEILRQIVHAREVLGLSWNGVSDHVDKFLAAKHGRTPIPRWNRAKWTKGGCCFWYRRRHTILAADRATHRRCQTCRQSKPIKAFSLHNGRRRRVCKQCRAVRTFRQRDDERQARIHELLLDLTRLACRGRATTPRAVDVAEELVAVCGSVEAAVAEWKALLDSSSRDRPGGRQALTLLKAFSQMLIAIIRRENKARQESTRAGNGRPARGEDEDRADGDAPDLAALNDAELESLIKRLEANDKP